MLLTLWGRGLTCLLVASADGQGLGEAGASLRKGGSCSQHVCRRGMEGEEEEEKRATTGPLGSGSTAHLEPS